MCYIKIFVDNLFNNKTFLFLPSDVSLYDDENDGDGDDDDDDDVYKQFL